MIIQDFHGNFLSIVNGCLVSTRESFDLGVMVAGKFFIFYEKNQGGNFSVNQGGRQVCGQLFLSSINENGSISFLHQETGRLLSAIPIGKQDSYQSCDLRDTKAQWEMFSIDSDSSVENINNVVEEDLFYNPDLMTSNEIIKIIKSNLSNNKKKILLSSLVATFELYFQELLFEIIEKMDIFSESIIDIVLENNEIKKSIIELIKWLKSGRHEEYYYDISGKFLGFERTSLPQHKQYNLNIDETILHCVRRQILPRKKSCIVVTIKNEGVYILDWIAHHRAMGFEKIFIYSNDNTDNSDDLLKILSEKRIITWIKNTAASGSDAQGKSYSHALMFNKEILNYEWSAFVDMDEFICVNKSKFHNINEFLMWHSRSQEDCICINWCFVSPSNQSKFDPNPIFSRFDTFDEVNIHIKSCFKPRLFYGSHPHYPIAKNLYNPIFVESDKSIHTSLLGPTKGEKAFSDFPTDREALVYHYFLKSAEEFLWKFSRNRGNHPSVCEDIYLNIEALDSFSPHFLEEYKKKNNNYKTGRFMMSAREKSLEEREKLMQDVKISNCYNLILSTYKMRMQKIIQLYKTYEGKSMYCKNIIDIIESK